MVYKMRKILLVGSQHGNERIGEQLYAVLTRQFQNILPQVDYILANPKAYDKNVRFIETDMNRAYASKPITYEEKQAQYILETIKTHKYDFVLDMHTTTSTQNPCFITADINDERKSFMKSSDITHVVVLPKDIAKASLIGAVSSSLAIEVSVQDITDTLLVSLAKDIERYLSSESVENTTKEIFYVSGALYKSEMPEAEALKLINFKQSKHGFYPLLVGETAYSKYKDYYGYKADVMDKVTL